MASTAVPSLVGLTLYLTRIKTPVRRRQYKGSGAWYDCDTAWDFVSVPPAATDPAAASATPLGYFWMAHLARFWGSINRAGLEPCGGAEGSRGGPPLQLTDRRVQVGNLRTRIFLCAPSLAQDS